MPNAASNAIVGKPKVSGGILVAPVGTATPTNESTNPNVLFSSVGYLGDAGLSRSEGFSSDIKRAWGGDPLIIINKDNEQTAKFMFAEYLNPLVQQLLYGDENVTITPATATAGNKMKIVGKDISNLPHKSWIIELFSGDAKGRVVFFDAQISARDDVDYKDDDITARGVTITLFPNTNGEYFNEFWDDGRKVLSA